MAPRIYFGRPRGQGELFTQLDSEGITFYLSAKIKKDVSLKMKGWIFKHLEAGFNETVSLQKIF